MRLALLPSLPLLPFFILLLALGPSPTVYAQTPSPSPAAAVTAAPSLNYNGANNSAPVVDVDDDIDTSGVACNISVYNEWANEPYGVETTGLALDLVVGASNLRWWDTDKYDNDKTFVLTNRHAIEVLGTKCRQYMQALKVRVSETRSTETAKASETR